MEPAGYRIEGGSTTVPLSLAPWESVFVVFRKPAPARSRVLPRVTRTTLARLDGPWPVEFQPDRGAPARIELPTLASWSAQAQPGVRYFSGTGTYRRTIVAPSSWFSPGARLWLDLGTVDNVAQVTVNGRTVGTAWKAPFRVELTGALKPGSNEVAVAVTNLWVNRLVGDRQPGAKQYTFTTDHPYTAGSPLLPSGLLGPVVFERQSR